MKPSLIALLVGFTLLQTINVCRADDEADTIPAVRFVLPHRMADAQVSTRAVSGVEEQQPPAPETSPQPISPIAVAPGVSTTVTTSDWSPAVWGGAEFLYWWFRGAHSPPLVTASSPTTLPVLGNPGTAVVVGNTLDGQIHPGARFTLGLGRSEEESADPAVGVRRAGVELTYFFASQRTAGAIISSPGSPSVGRPFVDVGGPVPVQTVEQVGNPFLVLNGVPIRPLAGTVAVGDSSRLWGFEANAVSDRSLFAENDWGFKLLAGFRQLAFDEDLTISENLVGQSSAVFGPGGDRNVVRDSFSTRNRFYGGQIGAGATRRFGRFSFMANGKLAIGDMHEEVNITGFTQNTLPGGVPVTGRGGLLAQSTNIGTYARDRFAVVPEAGVTLGYHLTPRVTLTFGYNFLYVSDMARSGDQIDLAVNSNVIPAFAGGMVLPPIPGGPARPAFTFQSTDFWSQGITTGLQFVW